jgi:hypothetical protein
MKFTEEKLELNYHINEQIEILRENIDGLFFDEININSITEKFIEFDKKINEGFFNRIEISKNTKKFDESIFIQKLGRFIEEKWNSFYSSK